ncbi:MAG: class II fructose-bisphosphate aldolase [Clostridiales bacterium]|nr:class II fructose-bisphosphate aldolase [Clostridiales bacterium]
MKQVKMLEKALKEQYIVPAFNFTNFETLTAIIDASIEMRSPVILQLTEKTISYFGVNFLKGIIKEIKKIKHPISVHFDHAKNLDIIKLAMKLGCDSVMIDGSNLDFYDNIKLTKKVVKYAHGRGVSVEGELGVLSKDKENFTDPKIVKEFVEKTKVDSLAVAIGTSHGIHKYDENPRIHYNILKKIQYEILDTPIVLHGASLVDQNLIEKFNANGGKISKAVGNENLLKNAYKTNICKINIDTDLRLEYTASVREFLKKNKDVYCPRTYGEYAKNSVKELVKKRIKNICKSNDKI